MGRVSGWMQYGWIAGLVVWLSACGGGGAPSAAGGGSLAAEKSQSSENHGTHSGSDDGVKHIDSGADTDKKDQAPDHEDSGTKDEDEGQDQNGTPDEEDHGTPGGDGLPRDDGDDDHDDDNDDDQPEPDPPSQGPGNGGSDEDGTQDDSGDDQPGNSSGDDSGEDTGGGTDDPDVPAEEGPPGDDSENAGDGSDFPIVTLTEQQVHPRLTHQIHADQYFAVWNDQRDDGLWRVIGRGVNVQSGAHGALKAISESGVAPYTAPGVAHDAAGGRSMVVWGTAAGDVIAQAVDGNGDPLSAAVMVANGAATEVQPVIGFDPGAGRYVVAWIESSPHVVVYTRALDRDGAVLNAPTPLTEVSSGKLDLRLAVDPEAGRFLVVWRDYRGQDLYSIFGRLVDADGRPVSDELVIADVPGAQILPQVAFDPTQRTFLVTWSDTRRSGIYELYGQIVTSPDGVLLGDNVWIDVHGGSEHALGADPSRGAYVIAYPHPTRRLYARYLGADGRAEGEPFPVSTVPGNPSAPHVAVDPDGLGFLAAWADDRLGPLHLFGRWISTDDSPSSPGGPPPATCAEFRDGAGACLDCELHAGPLVDQSCPVAGTYGNHGAYMGCVTAAVNTLRAEGIIGGSCKLKLIAPRARSSVGR